MKIRFMARAILAGLLVTGAAQAQTVTVMGSTALGPIVKKAAEDYMKSHPGVQIAVSGGGSMTGLNQVTSGGCQIGISDVFATPDQEKAGIKNHNIVVQPFTLVAHPGVGVKNLSAQQAEQIFTGKIVNWQEVGGQNRKIVRVIRPESSGTRAVQKKTILHDQEFAKDVLIQDSTGAVVAAVATTPGAISFVELEHLEKNKNRIAGIAYNGVACSNEAVKSGKYPVFSFGHAYTNPAKLGDPKVKQAVEDFLAYILSPSFQRNVIKAGYLPVDYVKSLKTKL
ncbi:phosphate ABC transporter substrate-binding protein [Geothrix sp. SG200]|uniref:phosphate ABC transporter substrate-binding protein n=1 Tax=Geothrix sp. SG200 TaxID=2922865 RepID=UPI001FAD4F3D|nr:phosphate ABC transporter substrate-binding protein [Geothrix sp. SG200]